ncbi:MAG: CoA-binding protein [Acidimicrobiales bacterium]
MTVDRFAVDALLAQQHLAVVGASDHPGNFGRTIVHELAARGYDVTAVHPTATSVDGRPATGTSPRCPTRWTASS